MERPLRLGGREARAARTAMCLLLQSHAGVYRRFQRRCAGSMWITAVFPRCLALFCKQARLGVVDAAADSEHIEQAKPCVSRVYLLCGEVTCVSGAATRVLANESLYLASSQMGGGTRLLFSGMKRLRTSQLTRSPWHFNRSPEKCSTSCFFSMHPG